MHINNLAAYYDLLLLLCPMRGQITIKGAPCNAQARTDTVYRARAGCVELQRHRKRLGLDGFAPSTFPAPPSRTGQSCQGPLPVGSKNSCGLARVVFQEPPESFTALDWACTLCVWADHREEKCIVLALMIPLVMKMRHVLRQRMVE